MENIEFTNKVNSIRYIPGFTLKEPFHVDSTYDADYKKIDQPRVEKIILDRPVTRTSEPFPSNTKYRDEFKKYEVPYIIHRPIIEYIPSQEPLSNLTTNRCDYTVKKVKKQLPCMPDTFKFTSDYTRFDHNSTNREDFIKWNVPPSKGKQRHPWEPPSVEMDSNTVYRSEFMEKPVPRVKAIYPPAGRVVSVPFEDGTTYNDFYKDWATKPNLHAHNENLR